MSSARLRKCEKHYELYLLLLNVKLLSRGNVSFKSLCAESLTEDGGVTEILQIHKLMRKTVTR